MPKVSVIVPNYNHARFLPQRLESIFKQTYNDYEVILLDDNSIDDSIEILMQYKNHPNVSHCIVNKVNSGSTFKQWEKGIKLAQGEYIWIAESDDVAQPEFLSEAVYQLDKNKRVGLFYCQSHKSNESSEVVGNMLDWTRDIDNKRWESDFINSGINEVSCFLSIKNTIPNVSAVLFRREAIKHSFKNIMQFRLCGDMYLYARILKYYDIYYSAKPLNAFRFHAQSVRNNTNRFHLLSDISKFYGYVFKNFPIIDNNRNLITNELWGKHVYIFIADKSNPLIQRLSLLKIILLKNRTFLIYFIRSLLGGYNLKLLTYRK